jgi:threonine synthase
MVSTLGDRDVTFPMLQNQNEMAPLGRLEELENENRRLREQLESLSQQQQQSAPAVLPPPPAVTVSPPVQVQQSSMSAPQLRTNRSRGEPFEGILARFVEDVHQIMSSLQSSTGTALLFPPHLTPVAFLSSSHNRRG